MRDEIDPHVLATPPAPGTKPKGWGPISRSDEWVIRVGEAVDMLRWALIKVNTEKGTEVPLPARWRRPGVLSAEEIAERELDISAPVIDQLEAERAERERVRQEIAARKVIEAARAASGT